MKFNFDRKSVFVTGGCGTIGRELVRQLLEVYKPGELIVIDNNESELFFLEQEFAAHKNASFYLGDIRDRGKLGRKMKGVNIVFHTAAFKHVILCERSPFEAVQTNILGVQNIITCSLENAVERVVFTSSDKAVNPTSVMGTSKLMGERLMTAANINSINGKVGIFIATRFGNVLGSRGSVIPIFREQIKKGGPITLTDPEMTRFIMSIREAVRLVIESCLLANGGEVFITKMPVIRIKDLAEVMIEELAPGFGHDPAAIPIQVIGSKPGEKMYEELMSHEETRRALELEKYFVVQPAYQVQKQEGQRQYSGFVTDTVTNPYHSGNETPLTKAALAEFLRTNHLLEEEPMTRQHPDKRHWPDFNGRR